MTEHTEQPVVGIVRGLWSRAVPQALLAACAAVEVRAVELPAEDLRVVVPGPHAGPATAPAPGPPNVPGAEAVTHLAPAVVHRQPWAQAALAALEAQGARALNPSAAAATADDKAATAIALAAAGVAQVPTVVVDQAPDRVAEQARRVGYPVVVKRTHGAQGRWVRLVAGPEQLPAALDDLAADGVSALVLQPFAAASNGSTVRVIVTGGEVLAATVRTAETDDFRSNIFLGGLQHPVELSQVQRGLAIGAAAALGLGHAGVDLIDTGAGFAVLEVNACPDFTSMRPHTGTDIAAAVVAALLLR